jgi:hypothetical protein
LSSQHSTNWFWSDWAGDLEVRRLTVSERGLWIDLLCLAAVGKPTGYVCDQRGNPLSNEEIGRFANASPTEVESLIAGILEKGAASRDRTGRLFNRRMVRQAEKAAVKRAAGKLGGGQTREVWKSLRVMALDASARASTRPLAVAPRDGPFQSNKQTTTVRVERGLGNEAELKRPAEVSRTELAEIYARKGTPR